MNQLTPVNKFRMPIPGIIAIAGLLIALVAIFVFKVALALVLNYGFFAVMLLSHFWMHGSRGHNNNRQENSTASNESNQLNTISVKNNDSQNHGHGCH
jgi:hypothetical protein